MPFASDAQRRFMFARHKRIAKRWVKEAKKAHEPVTKSLVEISKGLPSALKGQAKGRLRPLYEQPRHVKVSPLAVQSRVAANRQGREAARHPAGSLDRRLWSKEGKLSRERSRV